MKKNIDSYSVYPLVVPAGEKSRVRVYCKMSGDGSESGVNPWGFEKLGGRFGADKRYAVKVHPREIFTPDVPADVDCAVCGGYLEFEYLFLREQEYFVSVSQKSGDQDRQLTFFKLYALEKDLYALLPLKGETHMHSNCSDGRQPPEIMYATARKAGMEFAALTDHYFHQPTEKLKALFSGVDTGMKIYNGEEVHQSGRKMHIVSFGAGAHISGMLVDQADRFLSEAEKIAAQAGELEEDIDPVEYGTQRLVYDCIRQNGGVAILAHPYWPNEKGPAYLPASLTRRLIREGCPDAWEITGVDDGDKDFLQGVLYAEEKEKGNILPVVGSTDAHNAAHLGDSFSIVFARENALAALSESIRSGLCVGARQYRRADGEMRYMAFGPPRLVRYAMFLMNEFYPVQGRLCALEGELMLEAFTGGGWAKELIGKVAAAVDREKRLCFGMESPRD